MSLDKSVENITEADLVSLIEAGTPELKTLEYKEALPEHSAGAAKEFLADASSFANAAGGHLIYGMRAASGVATELVGLQAEGDPTISRLENMIRDGTAPRIPGLHSFAVKLANSKIAVVIRIPKSFASPPRDVPLLFSHVQWKVSARRSRTSRGISWLRDNGGTYPRLQI